MRFAPHAMALVAFLFGSAAQAESHARDRGFGLTADLTFASKYITGGFKVAGNSPMLQPSLNWEIFSTGASLMFWSSLPMDRRRQEFDEFDVFLRYSHDFFSNETWQVNLHGFYDYWFYPKSSTAIDDGEGGVVDNGMRRGNKLHAGASLPRLLKIADYYLVPTYNVYYWMYWAQNQRDKFQGGTHHELLLQYFHSIPRFLPGALAQYFGGGSSLNYNDGAFGVHPGWGFTTAQLWSSVFTKPGIVTLGLNYQWTHDRSINSSNEFWSTLSFTKRF